MVWGRAWGFVDCRIGEIEFALFFALEFHFWLTKILLEGKKLYPRSYLFTLRRSLKPAIALAAYLYLWACGLDQP